MSCTVEQIAEKKRIALERLHRARQQKQQTPQVAAQSPAASSHVATSQQPPSSNRSSPSTRTGNSATQFLSVNSFYAQSKPAIHPLNPPRPLHPNPRSSGGGSPGGGGKMTSGPAGAANHRHNPYSQKPAPSPNAAAKPATQLAPVFLPTKTAICSMSSAERFEVDASFNARMVDVFKTIGSREYDDATKRWSFNIADYSLLRDRMQPLQSDITLTQLPAFVLQLFDPKTAAAAANSQAVSLAALNALDPRLTAMLLPFQRLGVCFGISKQGRCMIADEMGLGKTYQALALASFYKNDWPLLVCTTAATRDSWVATLRKLFPQLGDHQICGAIGECSDDTQALVISYSLMERNSEQLLRRRFPFLILDESHLLKNIKAKSTRAALELGRLAKRVVLLTGTPALSRPCELFTQLQIIDGRFFTFKDYTTRYCAGKQTNFGWDASGQSHLRELNVVLSRRFMIRRTKQQVLFELGEKSRETVMLDRALVAADPETAENLESYAADMGTAAKEDVLLQYYRETAVAKLKAVCAYVKELVRQDEKFIMFAHHRCMLDAIAECLRALGVDHVRIDGRTANDARTKFVERFQTESKCRAAVLSLKACNAGITLTAAQLVIFAELYWNPSTLAQAESRAHRIGQTGQVRCLYLLAQGTADDLIWTMLQRKQETLNKAGLFSDDLADGALKMAPSSSRDIAQFCTKKDDAKDGEKTEAEVEDLSAFFADNDDDIAFAQIEL